MRDISQSQWVNCDLARRYVGLNLSQLLKLLCYFNLNFKFGIILISICALKIKTKNNTVININYCRIRLLRTPGQRLPSQSRLITYRIACKSQRVDTEEPNGINMCASAIIETFFEVGKFKLSLAKGRRRGWPASRRFETFAGRRTRSRQPRRDAPRSPKWLERRGIAEPCELGWGSP